MRNLVALIFWFLPCLALAQDWEDRQLFNAAADRSVLRILSSTDTAIFGPIITRFVADNPEVTVEYLVSGTSDIDRIFRAEPGAYDIVVSSAMDLQLKLVNDGLARTQGNIDHPPWAHWRQSLFAFTAEPAAIVINRAAFAGAPIPRTRQELIEAMRARPDVFRNRVGTYDVRQSGLGYLFATQDARASETFWRLMEVMGRLNVRLYCCSGDMIDDLADGSIAVSYNVLGSYAAARIADKDRLEILLPADFPTTMMRTVLVSRDARQPDLATAFVQHVVSLQGKASEEVQPLPLLNAQTDTAERAMIALEPALMTFLDTLKRRKFLAEWEDAVIQK